MVQLCRMLATTEYLVAASVLSADAQETAQMPPLMAQKEHLGALMARIKTESKPSPFVFSDLNSYIGGSLGRSAILSCLI